MPGSGVAGESPAEELTRKLVELAERARAVSTDWADERAVAYEHAAELAKTLLANPDARGVRISCRGCGRTQLLEFVEPHRASVHASALEGWGTHDAKEQGLRCPACVERGDHAHGDPVG